MAVDLTKFLKGRSLKAADFNFNDTTDVVEIKTDAGSAVGQAIAGASASTAETIDGAIDNKYVSPADMKAALQSGAAYPITVAAGIVANKVDAGGATLNRTDGPLYRGISGAAVSGEADGTNLAAYFNGGPVVQKGNGRTVELTNGGIRYSEGNVIAFGWSVSTLTCTIDNALSFNVASASDYRLKTIKGAVTKSGEFIDGLKPRFGSYIASPDKEEAFFVAHEVSEVSPTSVTGAKDAVDEDGNPIYQTVYYGGPEFIVNIIAELQSLRKRVAELEAK